MSSSDKRTGAIYEIRIEGELDPSWNQWFSGLDVTLTDTGEPRPTTTLVGRVTDQAALRGLLCKLWDLNLTLVSVRRVEAGEKEDFRNV
jgi:hypothetical protein